MRRIPPLVVIFAIVLIYASQLWMFSGFHIDDAYISFRYVRQWAAGNGLVYNIGERVEGYSNFLWIALLLPFAKIGVDLGLAAKVLGCLFGLSSLGLTYYFGQALSSGSAAAWLLACSAPFAVWTMGQLEAPLFAFLALAASFTFLSEEKKGAGWWSGVLFGLLALSRPEGILFFSVAMALRALCSFQERRVSRRDLWRIAACSVIVLPYFTWRLTYYGYPFPNTVYAKSMGLHPRALLEGLFYLYQSVNAAGGFFFLAITLALAIVKPVRSPTERYLAASVIAYAAFIVVGGGDWMPMQRFLVHIMPLLYLLVQDGLLRLRDIFQSLRWGDRIVSFLLAGQLAYLLAGAAEARLVQGVGKGPLLTPDEGVHAYLAAHVRPEDVIAVTDAGLIAYSLPLETRIVDMVGLTDEHIAHLPVQLPHGLFGRGDAFGKWDVNYILNQQPRFVQVEIRGMTPEGDYITNFTGTALLVNDPRFREAYEIVQASDIKGLFVRKEDQ
ncbi:MAG: ArnT family glycosyltransferase [Anaerolineae bacterium]